MSKVWKRELVIRIALPYIPKAHVAQSVCRFLQRWFPLSEIGHELHEYFVPDGFVPDPVKDDPYKLTPPDQQC